MNKVIYLYVIDTMADWEIGYLTAELNSGRYFKKGLNPLTIVTVGAVKDPITTMGGFRIMPDIAVGEFDIEKAEALILPGSDTWADSIHEPLIEKINQCLEKNILVAAICGATAWLADKGFLDSRWHTSSDLEYLKMAYPSYSGEKFYKNEPAVTDGNLITANGTAPLEFSFHVLKALDVFTEQTLDSWYQLFKTQEPRHFFRLMSSIQV